MNILVVEDDASVRRLLQTVLAPLGRVRDVATQEAANRLLRTWRPDVVLLDIMLHGRSGLSLLGRWRSREETMDLPVVLLTGLDDAMERRAGTAAGADAYVTKPFDVDHLVDVVRDVVSGDTAIPRGLLGQASRTGHVLPD